MPVARTRPRLAAVVRAALILALCGCGLARAAEGGSEAEIEAKTDKSDPQQVLVLAQWCDQNGLKAKALKYYNLVIRLDKDNEAARAALGQVKVGDHWVSAKIAGVQPTKSDGGSDSGQPGATDRQAKGPGPKASEMAWNLTPPPEPRKDDFIQKYIDQLPRVANDSQEMANSIATFLMDEHLGSAVSRLCTALADPGYNDCYGAATLVIELNKRGSIAVAKPMLPFLVKATEHVTDAEDLATACFVIPLFHDKRALPRLIELMASAQDDVRMAATDAVSALTLLPSKELSVEKAQHWWDLNHNASPQQIYSEQLNSRDPAIAVAAASALYDYRDKAIVPVLIRLITSSDRQVCGQAIDIIKKISGNDWGYDVTGDVDAHKKVADRLTAWWKDEQFKWVWMEDQKAAADAASSAASAPQLDPNRELVAKLGSVEGVEAQNAETSLRSVGEKAVPALIDGLSSATVIVRRKSNDLLKEIGKQEIEFDPRGSEADRAKAVAAWKAWAIKKGLIKEEDAAPADGGGDEATAGGDDDQSDQPKKKPAPKPAAPKKPAPKAGPAPVSKDHSL